MSRTLELVDVLCAGFYATLGAIAVAVVSNGLLSLT